MAAVHLPQYLANLTQPIGTENHIFCEIRPCSNSIEYARCEDFITFLCVLRSVFTEGFLTLRIMGNFNSHHLFQ